MRHVSRKHLADELRTGIKDDDGDEDDNIRRRDNRVFHPPTPHREFLFRLPAAYLRVRASFTSHQVQADGNPFHRRDKFFRESEQKLNILSYSKCFEVRRSAFIKIAFGPKMFRVLGFPSDLCLLFIYLCYFLFRFILLLPFSLNFKVFALSYYCVK